MLFGGHAGWESGIRLSWRVCWGVRGRKGGDAKNMLFGRVCVPRARTASNNNNNASICTANTLAYRQNLRYRQLLRGEDDRSKI